MHWGNNVILSSLNVCWIAVVGFTLIIIFRKYKFNRSLMVCTFRIVTKCWSKCRLKQNLHKKFNVHVKYSWFNYNIITINLNWLWIKLISILISVARVLLKILKVNFRNWRTRLKTKRKQVSWVMGYYIRYLT